MDAAVEVEEGLHEEVAGRPAVAVVDHWTCSNDQVQAKADETGEVVWFHA
jgi:hypothetical protein